MCQPGRAGYSRGLPARQSVIRKKNRRIGRMFDCRSPAKTAGRQQLSFSGHRLTISWHNFPRQTRAGLQILIKMRICRVTEGLAMKPLGLCITGVAISALTLPAFAEPASRAAASAGANAGESGFLYFRSIKPASKAASTSASKTAPSAQPTGESARQAAAGKSARRRQKTRSVSTRALFHF